MEKSEMLRRLDVAPVRTQLDDVDPERVIYEESGWRVKDIIAHVATWDAETLRSLHAFRRGTEYKIPSYVDDDDFNAYAATARMDESYEQIFADWDATRRWMRILINAMTPEDFAAEMTYPSGERGQVGRLLQEIFEHQDEHLDDIHRALIAHTSE